MKAIWGFLAVLPLLAPLSALAQQQQTETSGGITIGSQGVDGEDESSKFNEFRDVRDGIYLYGLWFDFLDKRTGLFLKLNGESLIRDDQSLRLRLGEYGSWRLGIDRNDTPHNLSNKALSPFISRGSGLFTLPTSVQTPNRTLTPVPSALLDNDAATAAWLATHLRAIDLGPDRRKTSGRFQYTPRADLKLRLSASNELRDGSKISYGPIGERPPRTLNVQFAEPVDHTTRELRVEAEYQRDTYRASVSYLYSDFDNEIGTLRWQNIYADAGADAGFDQWAGHRVATFGQRSLAPDNVYHNASGSFQLDLPLASHLTATAALGWMRQDETLLPYSTSDFDSTTVAFSSTAALPRARAGAEIDTKLVNVDYVVRPAARLNLRSFFRYYDLDNDTPQDNWWYVTGDTIPGAASAAVSRPTFKNQRINLAYSYDRVNVGLDATYYVRTWRTTLGARVERENIDRTFREADTGESIFKASIRTRPNDWLSLRAAYVFGDRDGDGYNTFVTSQSYWYDPVADAAGNLDNPKVSFSNHPDMRKFDVADRRRHEVDLAATVVPSDPISLTASFHFRDHDFDSNVRSTQPLLGSPFARTAADQLAATPGDQLGLLDRQMRRYSLDASYAPTERLTLTAFGSRETIDFSQRGLEFQENNKLDAASNAALQLNELGPWTRASNQWLAVTDDRTNTIGVGVEYGIVPGKLRALGDYVRSRGRLDVEYSGFGTQSGLDPTQMFADNFQFAFRTPPTAEQDEDVVSATLEYTREHNLVFGLHYVFDRYRLRDWMQEANTPWFESVGSEFLLRDTSAPTSTQWGNRLVNLGSFLAPSYDAHIVFATVTYSF